MAIDRTCHSRQLEVRTAAVRHHPISRGQSTRASSKTIATLAMFLEERPRRMNFGMHKSLPKRMPTSPSAPPCPFCASIVLLREPLEERGILPMRRFVAVGDALEQLRHQHIEHPGGLLVHRLGNVVGGHVVPLGQPLLLDLFLR